MFKEFAMRGNVIDMAVGTIIKSLVSNIIIPPVSLLLGNVDFSNIFMILKEGSVSGPYPSLAEAAPATKTCPYCFSTIDIKATRCANCTSDQQ